MNTRKTRGKIEDLLELNQEGEEAVAIASKTVTQEEESDREVDPSKNLDESIPEEKVPSRNLDEDEKPSDQAS